MSDAERRDVAELFGEAAPPIETRSAGDPLGSPHGQESVFQFVHRRLRGRYAWAIGLGLALAIPFALLAYKVKDPEFASTGIIRVHSKVDAALYSIPEYDSLPHFSRFVRTQSSLVSSRRVLELALQNEELRQTGWPGGAEGLRDLAESLSVSHTPNSELIYVRAAHSEPHMAQKAVNAVLDAYNEIYGERDAVRMTERERTLETRRRELERRLRSIRDDIFAITNEYGADMLPRLHEARIEDLERLSAQVAAIEEALTQSRLSGDAGASPSDLDPDVERLAEIDPTLGGLKNTEARIEAELGARALDYGPNHREIKRLRRELKRIRLQISERADELRDLPEAAKRGSDAMASRLGGRSVEELEEMLASYQQRRDEAHRQATALGRKRVQIKRLSEEETSVSEDLEETSDALDRRRFETENKPVDRVEVVERGEFPTQVTDKRKVLAAAGGAFGFGCGVGFVFLLGLLDRGYRYIDDLERSPLEAPLLGTLPDLTSRHPEHDEMAALSVHHVRNMLQSQARGDARRAQVFTITSAAAGDGKTSLTLALGMSFALSGKRTVLVDGDLVGRGLSREMGLEDVRGLSDVVRDGSLDGEAQASSVANLWSLPAGRRATMEAKHLSQECIARLIEQLCERFDTVLIDTGPVLGSLEANLAAPQSDGVVLAVARGQSQRMVHACLERLGRMHARCAGLVFNRASAHDFENSVSAASVVSQSMRSLPGESGGSDARDGRGPASRALVRAVIGDETEERR